MTVVGNFIPCFNCWSVVAFSQFANSSDAFATTHVSCMFVQLHRHAPQAQARAASASTEHMRISASCVCSSEGLLQASICLGHASAMEHRSGTRKGKSLSFLSCYVANHHHAVTSRMTANAHVPFPHCIMVLILSVCCTGVRIIARL